MSSSEFPVLLTVFFYGAILGSFLNVCIFRMPREISVISPPSACPVCKERLRWWENIPIVSYCALRGKCRSCGSRISFRYPAVEILTGLLMLFLWKVYPVESLSQIPRFLCQLVFLSLLVVIAFIDWDFQIVFDETTLLGTAAGFLYSFFMHQFWSAVLAAVGAGLFFYAIRVLGEFMLHQEAMGWGDVKLAGMLGAFLGVRLTILAVFLSFPIGILTALFLMITARKKRRDPVPFGPAMVAAALIVFFFGNRILDVYSGFLFNLQR